MGSIQNQTKNNPGGEDVKSAESSLTHEINTGKSERINKYKNEKFLFEEGKILSITRRGKLLKIFETFPIQSSRFISADHTLILPLKSGFSKESLNLALENGTNITLSDRNAGVKLYSNQIQEELDLIKTQQYKAMSSENFCHSLSTKILRRSQEGKLQTIRLMMYLSEDLGAEEELKSLENSLITQNNLIENPDQRWRTFLFSEEANFAAVYFNIFNKYCELHGWEFTKRSRRPAQNPVNALLNYGYAILKGKVDRLVTGSGLDPFVGMLHTLRPGRESLSLDLMEPFRQLMVDTSVIEIIHSKLLSEKDFELRKDEVRLSDDAKETLQMLIKLRTNYNEEESLILPMIETIRELLMAVISYTDRGNATDE